MKKVFLHCVFKDNLGDDLLIKTICNRYPNTTFTVLKYRRNFSNILSSNLKEININNKLYRMIRKVSFILKKRSFIDTYYIMKNDIVVIVGGSLFMESKNGKDYTTFWYKDLKKDYYILGSNIGPVYNTNFINSIKNNVAQFASDFCLRDKKSFNYLKACKNVRYAPDLVFTSKLGKSIINKQQRKIIISVINIEKKSSQIKNPNAFAYYNLIIKIIKYFQKLNYQVELFSFCKSEGDEDAINKIIGENIFAEKLSTYFYDGNIDNALDELSTAKIIIGSRFHANIIGMLMNKKIVPIIYNDKTRNLLEDVNFDGVSFDIDNLSSNIKLEHLEAKVLRTKYEISDYKNKAYNQFDVLDKVLKED